MYRMGGIVALVIGMTLASLWAFLPFNEDLGYLVSVGGEQPVWTRVEVECPDPWSVIFEGVRPPRGEYAMAGDECVRPARTFLTGAILAMATGVGLAVYGVSRGARPPVQPIEPISQLIKSRFGGGRDS
jgi:hypothetical protein